MCMLLATLILLLCSTKSHPWSVFTPMKYLKGSSATLILSSTLQTASYMPPADVASVMMVTTCNAPIGICSSDAIAAADSTYSPPFSSPFPPPPSSSLSSLSSPSSLCWDNPLPFPSFSSFCSSEWLAPDISSHVLSLSHSSVVVTVISPETGDVLRGLFDKVKNAMIPNNFETFVAIALGETIAGVIGGLSSRKIADFLGDQKRDTSFTKGVTTGAFFGARGVTRAGLQLLGLPRPFAILGSSVFASLVSEEAKFISRKQSESKNASLIDQENPKVWSDILSPEEVAADITKWLIYDALVELTPQKSLPILSALQFFAFGSLAGTMGFFVKEPPKERNKAIEGNSGYSYRLLKSSLEGGILFLCFEGTLAGLNMVVPDRFNKEFLLMQLIDSLEKEV